MSKADFEGFKRCPFCGNEAYMHTKIMSYYDPTTRDLLREEKEYCGMCAICGAMSGYKKTKKAARNTWNKRKGESD